jgi:RHS repeat-associated protein
VTISGSIKSFTYDPNGSMTGDGTQTYEWDGANRLVRVLNGGNEVARFAYDGDGRRSQKIAGGVTATYVYDRDDILEERLSTGSTIRYAHGPGIDQPLAKVESGAASYYLADHLGSIVQLTNASAAVTLTRQYDPWGNLIQGAGTAGYAFTSREWDSESGLHYYRSRYYDSSVGRFVSEDGARYVDGPHLYLYAFNNPGRWADPTGFNPFLSPIYLRCMVAVGSAGATAGMLLAHDPAFPPRSNSDKRAHCLAFCFLAQGCPFYGEFATTFVGGGKELLDAALGVTGLKPGSRWSWADTHANSWGTAVCPGQPCADRCASAAEQFLE